MYVWVHRKADIFFLEWQVKFKGLWTVTVTCDWLVRFVLLSSVWKGEQLESNQSANLKSHWDFACVCVTCNLCYQCIKIWLELLINMFFYCTIKLAWFTSSTGKLTNATSFLLPNTNKLVCTGILKDLYPEICLWKLMFRIYFWKNLKNQIVQFCNFWKISNSNILHIWSQIEHQICRILSHLTCKFNHKFTTQTQWTPITIFN